MDEFDDLDGGLRAFTTQETFYRKYHRAKQDPALFKEFMKAVNQKELLAQDIWIPEQKRDSADYFPETFIQDIGTNVTVTKHQRYNPEFRHMHAFFEMTYVYSGSCVNRIEEQPIVMNQGDFCLIAPDTSHTLGVFDDNSIVLNILIRKSTFRELFFDLFTGENPLSQFFKRIFYNTESISNYIWFHQLSNPHLSAAMKLLTAESWSQGDGDKKAAENLLRTVFCYLMRHKGPVLLAEQASRQSSVIKNILLYMQNNYQTVTLHELAKHFKYSPDHLGKMIKKQTGSTFVKILQNIRLQKACKMLYSTNLQILEICYSIGYGSVEFFNRTFKKQFGMTPTEYRRQATSLPQNLSGSKDIIYEYMTAADP